MQIQTFNKAAILLWVGLLLVLFGCKSRPSHTGKPVNRPTPYRVEVANAAENRKLFSSFRGRPSTFTLELLADAQKYLGAPYKFGGTDSKGFDCSGLMCLIFKENGVVLPRNSGDQGQTGRSIEISETRPGDLVFFATGGSARVSHVGVVHTINPDGEVVFLHASTSKGVILSSLNEKYWNKAFLFARRVEN